MTLLHENCDWFSVGRSTHAVADTPAKAHQMQEGIGNFPSLGTYIDRSRKSWMGFIARTVPIPDRAS